MNARLPPPRRIRVAILDSGIDTTHPAFAAALKEGHIETASFLDDKSLPSNADDDGHGTHTAYLALQVAPRSRLLVARVYRYGTPDAMETALPAI